MSDLNIEWARCKLAQLNPDQKFTTMLMTAAVLTKLLELEQIKPIIVGGFSIEIYTDEDYSTRDIDLVTYEPNITASLLKQLNFKKEGRHLVHDRLEVAIEFPDDTLAGSYEKVNKVIVDENEDLYVYVISYEDIIMDRLRAYLYWNEDFSKEWGMQILALHFNKLDIKYMMEIGKGAETEVESVEIAKWFDELKEIK